MGLSFQEKEIFIKNSKLYNPSIRQFLIKDVKDLMDVKARIIKNSK